MTAKETIDNIKDWAIALKVCRANGTFAAITLKVCLSDIKCAAIALKVCVGTQKNLPLTTTVRRVALKVRQQTGKVELDTTKV